MMRILRETYTGVRVIRAFDKASFEKSGQTKPLKGTQSDDPSQSFIRCLNPAVHFFMGLSILSILGFGGFQSLSGNLPIGSITAIIEYTVLSLWF